MKRMYYTPSMKVYKIAQVSAMLSASTLGFAGPNSLTGAPHAAEVNGETALGGLWDDLEGGNE